MSSTEKVVAAFTELRKRLAKHDVVLDPTSEQNGRALVAYCVQNGLDYQHNVTVDTLQTAFDALWQTGALKFVKGKEPKALRSKGPIQGTLSATVAAQKDLDARALASKKQEAVDAEAKRESVAQKATEEAIQAFALTKGGSMRYAPTNDFKTLLNQNVQRFRKDGMKWQLIFPQIKTWIAEKYQEFESQQSQSSTGGW